MEHMKLILLGPPGAGKGTQAELISKRLGIPTISTGNILRAAVKDGTPIGLQAKAFMDAGKLVPDDVILGIVEERLSQPDCAKGYILDGVPRTIAQAESLNKAGVVFDAVLSIEVSDQEIKQRMTGRRTCTHCGASYHLTTKPPLKPGVCDTCGSELIQREDDKLETVARRLEVYRKETEPLKNYYTKHGNLKTIPNVGSIEAVNQEIMKVLGQ